MLDAAAADGNAGPPEYVGLVTRAIGFVIDALIVNGVAVVTAAATALVLSVLPGSQRLHALQVAIAGAVFLIWCLAYWATFWSATGQTPGDRTMHIRVLRPNGERVRFTRGIVRLIGIVLAALPLFAGFVPVLLNDRRRGFHDWLADTVVIRAEPPVSAESAFAAADGAVMRSRRAG